MFSSNHVSEYIDCLLSDKECNPAGDNDNEKREASEKEKALGKQFTEDNCRCSY
jgi:hypothetical protein